MNLSVIGLQPNLRLPKILMGSLFLETAEDAGNGCLSRVIPPVDEVVPFERWQFSRPLESFEYTEVFDTLDGVDQCRSTPHFEGRAYFRTVDASRRWESELSERIAPFAAKASIELHARTLRGGTRTPLTGRGGRVECGLLRTSEIIRSIAEASEVTRPWRTLNISKSSSKGSSNGISGGKRHPCLGRTLSSVAPPRATSVGRTSAGRTSRGAVPQRGVPRRGATSAGRTSSRANPQRGEPQQGGPRRGGPHRGGLHRAQASRRSSPNVDLSAAKGLETIKHMARPPSALTPSTNRTAKFPRSSCAAVAFPKLHRIHRLAGGQSHRVLLLLHQLQS